MNITDYDKIEIIMRRLKDRYPEKNAGNISLRQLAEFLFKEVIEPLEELQKQNGHNTNNHR